jgi:hypothetical protein
VGLSGILSWKNWQTIPRTARKHERKTPEYFLYE